MTRITVVTIGWNNLAGMKRTFRSLAGQTHPDVEHLIVDGGSTDGSVEWIRDNVLFPRTIVISEADRGIFDAMNKGVRLATGEVLYFLNSGDCLAGPLVLQRVAASFEKAHWEWAVGKSQMVDENFNPTRRLSQGDYSWVRKTFWRYDLSHQAVFMATSLVRQVGGFDERYTVSADCHLITRVGRRYKPALLPWPVALTLDGGVSGTNMRVTHWQFHTARVEILDLNAVLRWLDVGWTGVLLAYMELRRLGRRIASGAKRGRLNLGVDAESGPA